MDIVAVGLDGKTPAQSVIDAAQAIVDRERPVGADARVAGAVETAVDIPAGVKLMDGGDLEGLKTAFSQALADFFRDITLQTDTVSHAKVLRLLLDCESVADVSGSTMNGSGGNLTLGARVIPVPVTLTLEEAT